MCNTNFHLVLFDATVDCGPRACINFVEFIWDNIKTFAFIKYAIVCVPVDTPKILFLCHYRSSSDVWRTYNLCAACCRDYRPSVRQFINNYSFPNSYSTNRNSCKCTLYLRQPPNLRIWLRIRSSITLSKYQSSNLPAERCFTSTFTLQTPISFPNIS